LTLSKCVCCNEMDAPTCDRCLHSYCPVHDDLNGVNGQCAVCNIDYELQRPGKTVRSHITSRSIPGPVRGSSVM
jgi:hypothetical protein